MAAPKDIIRKVKTKVYLNDKEIAVTGFSVNFNKNNIPTAQIKLALGYPFAVKKSTPRANPSDIKAGDTIIIKYGHIVPGSTQKVDPASRGGTIFEGVVSGVSTNRAGNSQGTSVGALVNCVSKLAYLGGLPTRSRAYFVQKAPTTITLLDKYTSSKGNQIFGNPSSADSTLPGMIESVKNDDINPAEFLLQGLEALYSNENRPASNTKENRDNNVGVRANNPNALEVLQNDLIIKNMDVAIDDTITKRLNLQIKRVFNKYLQASWLDSNGWTLLNKCTRLWYGAVIPTATNAYIVPDFPLSKTAAGTIKATEVFSASSRSMLDANPIVGIRCYYTDNTNDKAKDDKGSSELFAQYPPISNNAEENVEGIYQYMKVPAWAKIVRTLVKCKPEAPVKISTKSEPKNGGGAVQTDTDNEVFSRESIQEWAERLAKVEYNKRSWAKNSFSISVPMDFNYAPGMVIEIDLTSDEVSKQLFGDEPLFGEVQSVSIQSSFGSFNMSANIGYVRTKTQNDTYALDEHPIYGDYKMEQIPIWEQG